MYKSGSLTILGSGASPGVPYLGCTCPVCASTDPLNRRTRSSALVEIDGVRILIDTPPDLRAQCLAGNVLGLDAVLFTHTHADHLYGLDDLRAFKFIMGTPVDCYGPPRVLAYIRQAYPYLFDGVAEVGGGKPHLLFHPVEGPFCIRGVPVEPLSLPHTPTTPTTGYLLGGAVAYCLDLNAMPASVEQRIAGVDVLVLDMVQKAPGHPTHLDMARARDLARRIGAGLTVYSHLGHDFSWREDQQDLSDNEILAFDGLEVRLAPGTPPAVLNHPLRRPSVVRAG